MTLRPSITAISLAAAVLFGCSGGTQVQQLGGQSSPIKLGNLLVVLATPNLSLVGNDTGLPDVPGSKQAIYASYFAKRFPASISRYAAVDSVVMSPLYNFTTFREKRLALTANDSIWMALPTDSKVIRYAGITPDVILIIDSLTVSSTEVLEFNPVPTTDVARDLHLPTPDYHLRHQFQFAVWDNSTAHVLQAGRIDLDQQFHSRPSEDNWDFALNGVAFELTNKVPFQRSPERREVFSR
jgi:hypothetical protein